MTTVRFRLVAASILAASIAQAASADIEFIGLDVSPDDRILFSARVEVPGEPGYDTLFSADAETGELVQLTFYPESMAVVDDGRRLQIRNRFGVFMTERGFGGIAPLPGIPSFTRGSAIRPGRLVDSRPSPDGTMLLFLSPTSPARGNLILFDLFRNTETVVAKDIEYSADSFPASWSPDSRYFVYDKAAELYYFSTEQSRSGRIPDESWRKIGAGSILQARWSANGSLYLLRDRSMYRIMPQEFFTQAIYSGIVQPGVLVGKAPFPYDSNFDSFWISPDGSKVLLCKDGRNIFLYRLDPDDFGREAAVTAMPYLFLQGNTVVDQVLWPSNDEVTVFTASLKDGKRVCGAYRVKAPGQGEEGLSAGFQSLDVAGATGIALSPDESRVAIVTADGIVVRRYSNWASERSLSSPGALHAVWISQDKLAIASSGAIETVELADGSRTLVALGQPGRYGWSASEPGTVVLETSGAAYKTPAVAAAWTRAADFDPRPASTSSANYRVYPDVFASGSYLNTVMVRSAKGLGTRSLLQAPALAYEPFPDRDEPREPLRFDHGSRIRRRELSLVFNAYDGAEGLVGILDALREYGIRATFFVNGEFVRRNPGATRLIAESGHEIGNMFFSVFDATDSRYRADAEFIKRGLARTEDEYFAATGSELSLLWHSPNYSTSTDMLESAAEMNYTYVGRDVDPLDWVGRFQGVLTQGLYSDAHDLVERTVAAIAPGSIVPIRIGIPDGGRADYFYNELPLLINAVLAEGYEIVPVSVLMKHAE
ncbi:MAG: polysaccharide deacetylase family protein [Spirochaetae bacterium HGW-Spirochaetae-3]|jgi:peptidoglycan/xylan/chitin deacetylase (PgdA/CDA1 family)|nr:MAG: polysaccharide deacetylase family protein [Spirochaetae bacterium HGW-Spirochaetae-3]